jgi:prefoldin subunit 5
MSLDLAAVRQSVDRLAAERQQIAGDLAAVRQSVDRLAAQHQQMAGDISNLQAAQQALLRKVSTVPAPSPRQPRNPQN